jgi:hypothetical protein
MRALSQLGVLSMSACWLVCGQQAAAQGTIVAGAFDMGVDDCGRAIACLD